MKKRTIFNIVGFFISIVDLLYTQEKNRYIYSFNKDWDLVLNKIIDAGELKEERGLCAVFIYREVEYSIAIERYPFSYGYAVKINEEYVPHGLRFRAKEKTMKRLFDFLAAPHIEDDNRKIERLKDYITGKDGI